jgi:tetratricopeptide (TPR) repeat protein
VSGDTLSEIWKLEVLKGLELMAGDDEAAAACFARAYRQAPGEPTVCYAYGRSLLDAGDHVAGEALLRSAIAADPSLVGAASILARHLGLVLDRLDEAHAVLDSVDGAGATEIVRAELLLEQGRADEARRAARRARELEPYDPYVELGAVEVLSRADNHDGVTAAAEGRLDESLFYFRRAAASDPDWVAPPLNSAIAFERLERIGPALRCVEQALEIDPDCTEALVLRSRLLHKAGHSELAIDNLLDIARDAESAELLCVVTELCIEIDAPGAVAELLATYLQRNPEDPGVWFALGTCQLAASALGEAEDCFRQSLDLDAEHTRARQMLADVLARQGRYLEAAAQAERASALDPTSPVEYLGRPRRPKHPKHL